MAMSDNAQAGPSNVVAIGRTEQAISTSGGPSRYRDASLDIPLNDMTEESGPNGGHQDVRDSVFSLDDMLSSSPPGQSPVRSSHLHERSFADTATMTHSTGPGQSSDSLMRRISTREATLRGSTAPRIKQSLDAPLPAREPLVRPGHERVRRYTKVENPLTTWYFGGKMMTGGDNWFSVAFAVTVLLGIAGVWLGTTGVWFWVHGREYGLVTGGGVGIVVVFVYLFGLTTSSLIASSVRDPGIIPRRLDVDPPLANDAGSEWEPLEREYVVRRGKVTVRYCETCKSYRPPRCSHCRLCGNCVDGIDHHCAYLHTCVGKRNYLSFLVLLISAAISAIYVVVFSALHFSLLCHVDSIGFGQALRESPGAAVSFLLGVGVLPAVLFLLGYHCKLMFRNLTTVESIRASSTKNLLKATKSPDVNPFSADWIGTNLLLTSIARPQFPSWIQADRWDYKDIREPNPALTDPRLWQRPD